MRSIFENVFRRIAAERKVRGRYIKGGRIMKRKLIAALLCGTMVLSMAACSGGGDSGSSDGGGDGEASSDGGKTVELWTCWTEGADTEKAGTEQIAKWEEETGNKVNQTNFTYDMLHEKILTAAAGGNVPDLIWGLPEYVGEFYNMGILEDLTDRFNGWDDKSALSDAVVNAMTIDDKIVGIPYEMTVRAYLVHEDQFKDANVETPATWEDLLKLTDYKEKNGQYPTELACTGVRSAQELLVYLAQYDLEIASAQDGGKYKCTWNDNKEELENATKVFQFYKDLVDKGIIDENCKNWGWEETDENFATGIVGSYVTGNWLAEREEGNADTMGDVLVAPIPYPSDGQAATYMECKPLFILSDSKNKEGPDRRIPDSFCQEWQEAGFADRSPRSDVSTESKWSKDFQALSDTGITFPPVTLGGVTQAMQDAMAKVLQEGESPEETAKWLCDAVNKSLEDSGELSE